MCPKGLLNWYHGSTIKNDKILSINSVLNSLLYNRGTLSPCRNFMGILRSIITRFICLGNRIIFRLFGRGDNKWTTVLIESSNLLSGPASTLTAQWCWEDSHGNRISVTEKSTHTHTLVQHCPKETKKKGRVITSYQCSNALLCASSVEVYGRSTLKPNISTSYDLRWRNTSSK